MITEKLVKKLGRIRHLAFRSIPRLEVFIYLQVADTVPEISTISGLNETGVRENLRALMQQNFVVSIKAKEEGKKPFLRYKLTDQGRKLIDWLNDDC